MTAQKKAYAAICHRCEGTGTHQRGRCYNCHGKRIVGLKSSTVMKTFQHTLTIDGQRKHLVTWGHNLAEATRCAEIWMDVNGYAFA